MAHGETKWLTGKRSCSLGDVVALWEMKWITCETLWLTIEMQRLIICGGLLGRCGLSMERCGGSL